ncbi:thiol:disulfide interchange protein, partial [Xanthomonas arboricola pv. pruni]
MKTRFALTLMALLPILVACKAQDGSSDTAPAATTPAAETAPAPAAATPAADPAAPPAVGESASTPPAAAPSAA